MSEELKNVLLCCCLANVEKGSQEDVVSLKQ